MPGADPDANALTEAEDGGLTLGGAAQDALDGDAFDWTTADEENRAKVILMAQSRDSDHACERFFCWGWCRAGAWPWQEEEGSAKEI